MLPQVYWLYFTLPWVSMYRLDEIEDMSAFRKYASEQQCDNDTPFAEFKPYGISQCFSQCLQLASCTLVRYHPKKLICQTSKTAPSAKPKNSKSDQGWICWNITRQVPCPDHLQGTRCFKARSGQTKCVPYDLQEKLQKKVRMLKQVEKVTELFNTTPQDLQEKLQKKVRMLKQVEKVTELFNTTPQALNDKWTTTKGQLWTKSMTWSPLCSGDFYSLIQGWFGYSIERYTLQGNTLVKQSGQKQTADGKFMPNTIDTGPCLTDDRMNCIHLFGKSFVNTDHVMHVLSYRVLSPRQLVVERQGDIKQQVVPAASFEKCVFVCNWKSGLVLYLPQGGGSAVEKYSIQAGEGAFSLTEAGHVEGLRNILHFKWNNDGTFAFAMSATTLYLINDKEQVLIGVQHKWKGLFRPVCTNTTILVEMTYKGVSLRHVLKF